MKSVLVGVALSIVWSLGLHFLTVWAVGRIPDPVVVEVYRDVCWPGTWDQS
jgi:hypothetical protein